MITPLENDTNIIVFKYLVKSYICNQIISNPRKNSIQCIGIKYYKTYMEV